MSETLLATALGVIVLLVGGAIVWLRLGLNEQAERVTKLNERVTELEVGGLRESNALERKLTEALTAIRESLVRIESRLEHLERGQQHQGSARNG